MPVGGRLLDERGRCCLPLSCHQQHDLAPSALGSQFFVQQFLHQTLWFQADNIVGVRLVQLELLPVLLAPGCDALQILQLPLGLVLLSCLGTVDLKEEISCLVRHELLRCSTGLLCAEIRLLL